jgi:hypothetical protein
VELDLKNMRMVIFMKGNLKKVKHMVKEFTLGILLEKYMMVNGIRVQDMGMESGKMIKGIPIWENGN